MCGICHVTMRPVGEYCECCINNIVCDSYRSWREREKEANDIIDNGKREKVEIMNNVHVLKLDEHFEEAVVNGDKCFEVRFNDRGFQKGDKVIFMPVEDGTGVRAEGYHEIDEKIFEITYVLSGWGIKEGYVVFGIKEIKDSSV